jgi:hypothetical protein
MAHNKALAMHEHPLILKCRAAGQATAEQVTAKRGPIYDKWRENMRKALSDHLDT